ncbi:hypothetical protein HDA40_002218 [Hamadaea flava]|uniref:Uncharacterized protein n=1 Tax=Hamadaea flava TaxID=1742688 RepID=A0ABV8LLA2_9ACTN|nr:hypothetical protein [Hamadaea flava]MCP2323711.1 hypothetical protein [Hamadaea flava]
MSQPNGGRDYFGFDETAAAQQLEVPDQQTTDWDGIESFEVMVDMILSEDPNGPRRLADAYGRVLSQFSRHVEIVDGRARYVRVAWNSGLAQERYFWFAGAHSFALDTWIDGLQMRIEVLEKLADDVQEARDRAEELLAAFRKELKEALQKIKADTKAEYEQQAAEIYARLNKKYAKKIRPVGKKLSADLISGSRWLGDPGTVPPRYRGADAAKPWRAYSPEQLGSRSPTDSQPPGLIEPLAELPQGPVLDPAPDLLSAADFRGLNGLPTGWAPADQTSLLPTAYQPTLTGLPSAYGPQQTLLGRLPAGPILAAPPQVPALSSRRTPPQLARPVIARRAATEALERKLAVLEGRFAPAALTPPATVDVAALSARGGLEQVLTAGPAAAVSTPAPAMTPQAAMSAQQTLTGRGVPASAPVVAAAARAGPIPLGARRRVVGVPRAEPASPRSTALAATPETEPERGPTPPTLAQRLAAG